MNVEVLLRVIHDLQQRIMLLESHIEQENAAKKKADDTE